MEKTILIDGKEIRFKSTGATALRYKAQFGKDYLSEILKLNNMNKLDLEKFESGAFEGFDFEVFYNIAWVMAKTATPSIPDPITWLDEFESFPMMDIIPELQDMLISSIQAKKK
jgi:hypothetical protein